MDDLEPMPDPRVKVGMAVRDADGKRLGKVTRCNRWGFEVVKGFWMPSEWVIRWDEIVEVSGGEVLVARSREALFELAAGRLPSTWQRLPTQRPPGPTVPGTRGHA